MKENNWLDNPNLYGSGCVLQVYGRNFEPALFLNGTSFNRKLIIFKEKIDFPERFKDRATEVDSASKDVFGHAHLVLRLSQSEISAIQLEEATLFLKQYRDEILRLSNFPKVEQVLLQFRGLRNEQQVLPSEFENLAFGSGIKGIFW